MTIKQTASGRYEVTGLCDAVAFHVGIFDTIEQAERADHQLNQVQPSHQVFTGSIHLSLSAGVNE